jgi:hypothetical protein
LKFVGIEVSQLVSALRHVMDDSSGRIGGDLQHQKSNNCKWVSSGLIEWSLFKAARDPRRAVNH